VIDKNALYTALKDGNIAAAGLDAMVDERPKPDHPIFSLPNVTPPPFGRAARREPDVALPRWLRQHPARGGRPSAAVGDSRIAQAFWTTLL
jgi:hypothetical protein